MSWDAGKLPQLGEPGVCVYKDCSWLSSPCGLLGGEMVHSCKLTHPPLKELIQLLNGILFGGGG